jgi:hypothetical protein
MFRDELIFSFSIAESGKCKLCLMLLLLVAVVVVPASAGGEIFIPYPILNLFLSIPYYL